MSKYVIFEVAKVILKYCKLSNEEFDAAKNEIARLLEI